MPYQYKPPRQPGVRQPQQSHIGNITAPAPAVPAPPSTTPAAPSPAWNANTAQPTYNPSNYQPVARSLPENATFTSSAVGGMANPERMNQRLGMLPEGVDFNNNQIFGQLTPAMGWKPTVGDMAKAWSQDPSGVTPMGQFGAGMTNLSEGKMNRLNNATWDRGGDQVIKQYMRSQQMNERMQQRNEVEAWYNQMAIIKAARAAWWARRDAAARAGLPFDEPMPYPDRPDNPNRGR